MGAPTLDLTAGDPRRFIGMPRSHSPAPPPPAQSTRSGWVLGVLLVGPFMAQADATIANVATPSIHADLGASGAALELVVGGYLTRFAVLLITGARLGQTHGYRRVFLIAVAVFGLASLACGPAPDPAVLGVAAFATLYFSLSHLGPAHAPRAFAIVTAAFAAAAAVAMVAARRATTAPAVAERGAGHGGVRVSATSPSAPGTPPPR